MVPDSQESAAEAGRITGSRSSINSLVHTWMLFVRQIEQGYDDCIYEYTNDMSSRRVWKSGSPHSARQSKRVSPPSWRPEMSGSWRARLRFPTWRLPERTGSTG